LVLRHHHYKWIWYSCNIISLFLHVRKYQDQWEQRIGIWIFSYETRVGASSSSLFAAFSRRSLYHGPPRHFAKTSTGVSSCIAIVGSTCNEDLWSSTMYILCGATNNLIGHMDMGETK
jgi:hypothetical protein